MALNSFVDRSRLAQKISSAKNLSAQTVSNALFLQHPEWLDRFGERGRQSCTDDIRFHIEFLAGSIEAGSPESFADYAQWTTNMLAARGIVGDSLKESFAQISHHLSGILSAEERTLVATFLNGESKAGTEAAPASLRGDPPDELKLARKVFLSAILSGQRQAALTVVEEALRCGCAMPDIYVEVFDQALHQVGRLEQIPQ